jgi:PAS domain S-box-containing protein
VIQKAVSHAATHTKDSAEDASEKEHASSRDIIEKAGLLQLPQGQAEALLATIVEHSTDAIYSFDVRGKILTWNPAAERLFGYSSQEIVGEPIDLLIPSDGIAELMQILARINDGERVQHFETVQLNKNEARIDVALTVSPFYHDQHRLTGFSAVARDIRDHRAAQQERQSLIALVENSPDLIGLADFAKRLVFLNRSGKRLLGQTKQNEMGVTFIFDVFSEEERQQLDTVIMPALLNKGMWNGELRLRNFGSGASIPVLCNLFVIGDPNSSQAAFFACVARDLTERKRAEAALIQSERLAASGRMAATVAHEINNPLESIMNLLYLLERETLTPAGGEYLRIATQELHRVSQIARQTLGFYRGNSSTGIVSLKEALENVLNLFSGQLLAKNINLVREFETDGRLKGVAGEFRQVFSNLVTNAIDAMPAGGTLIVSTKRTQFHDLPAVEVRVSDTGEGIPRSQLQTIFDPFFTTKSEKGTGLGLWVSRNIIHQYGGEIAASTEEDPHRTIFSVIVPAEEKAA